MNFVIRLIKSKILSAIMLLSLIFISILQAVSVIDKDQLTLATIYFLCIIAIISIICNVFFTYIFNLLIYKFIVGMNFSNKTIFLNIISFQLLISLIYSILLKVIFYIDNFWILLLNPISLVTQYLVYLYLVEYEKAKNKRVLIYLGVNLIIPIIFYFIKV